MDHSQRGIAGDSSNAASASPNLMPNVLFREIHKNAFLKRHSSDRRTGFPRKSERVWVVFCVHDDVEPFLEIYPDQKVALTHKPEWFASLSSALHVSPTICGHEDEYEFAVTLSFQVVRLSAPSWESMMEWVETIRNKLRELKVLCPKDNIYSKMPEQKQALLPTRDPNSPLPLPPEGPSTLLPGVELVHLDRNGQSSNDGNSGRHQRDAHSRHAHHERRGGRRRDNVPERDPNSVLESSHFSETSNSSNGHTHNGSGSNALEGVTTSCNLSSNLQQNKGKVRKGSSAPQPTPSTSNIPPVSNITVIEVSTENNSDGHFVNEFNPVLNAMNGNEDSDDVFARSSVSQKPDIKNSSPTEISPSNENDSEVHYEHVFFSSVPVNDSQLMQQVNCKSNINCVSGNQIKKPHSTSVLIRQNSSNHTGSSQDENVASTSNINVKETLVGNSTCVNINVMEEAGKCDANSPLSPQIQSKLEKVNISGLIPRVPAKSTKLGAFKPIVMPARDSNLNIVEARKSSPESVGDSGHTALVSEEQDLGQIGGGESSKSNNVVESPALPAYSQVKKVHKMKARNDETRSEEEGLKEVASPIFSRKKNNEIQVGENELQEKRKPESLPNSNANINQPCVSAAKPQNKIIQPQKPAGSKKPEIGNINLRKDVPRNSDRNQHISNNEGRNDISSSGPSTSGNRLDNVARKNVTKKETAIGCNNNSEIEPITASVQPTVGVISVEDIPLIGGHQRRRRRSSSSDAAPASNVQSSRGIGGADRIRINVPLNANLPVRESHRNENETRASNYVANVAEQNLHINMAPQSTRLTLREQQVLQLRKEMLHPGGVRLQLRRKDCTGSIALVDVLNGVWVAGWKQKEHPLLYNALHIGDQLISVSEVVVRSSADAQKLIRSSTSLYIEFIIRRVPFGNVFALQRSSEGQSLGIVQEGNTAEIKDVLPNSIAARQGLTSKTPSCDGLSLTTWFLTEINGRPLNLFFKDNEVRDRLNAVGKEISILVQPHDFIKQIKKQLKNIRSYKDYIVQ